MLPRALALALLVLGTPVATSAAPPTPLLPGASAFAPERVEAFETTHVTEGGDQDIKCYSTPIGRFCFPV